MSLMAEWVRKVFDDPSLYHLVPNAAYPQHVHNKVIDDWAKAIASTPTRERRNEMLNRLPTDVRTRVKDLTIQYFEEYARKRKMKGIHA